MVNILKDFCNVAVAREKRRLALNAISAGRPAPLVNVAMETPPVVVADVDRPSYTMLVTALNCFIFLPAFCELQFHQINMPQCPLIFFQVICLWLLWSQNKFMLVSLS